MAKKKQVHTLEDLLVEEVSVVDRPANKRRFLTVKSEEGKGDPIEVDDDGKLITPNGQKPGEAPGDVSIADAFRAAGEGFAALEKRLTIDPEVRREIFQNLGEAMGRLNTIMGACDIAQSDRTGSMGDSTLLPVLASELGAVSKVLTALSSKLGKSPAKKDDGGEEKPETPENATEKALEALVGSLETEIQKRGAKMSKTRLAAFKAAMETLGKILQELDGSDLPPKVEKAVWTTAQVNDFPDSSFMYIKPGGTKDSSGKTVPRTNRMFPIRDGAGKLDLPHLRNAIARIPQANIPADLKTKLQEQARKLLDATKGEKTEETKKSDDTRIVSLTKSVLDLSTIVKKQAKDLRVLRQARPGSNSIPVEKGAEDGPPRSVGVSWPLDMNDEKTPERVDKATSFLDS